VFFWERLAEEPTQPVLWGSRRSVSRAQLSDEADQVAALLLENLARDPGSRDLHDQKIAFWFKPSVEYVAVQWGIWRAGAVAVPLCVSYPVPELEYSIRESQAQAVLYGPGFEPFLNELKARNPEVRFYPWPEGAPLATQSRRQTQLPQVESSWSQRAAQILFTSGTTGKPKGAVASHANLEAQIETLIRAWAWTAQDHTVHVLPLHHTHGIVNVLCCALASGAPLELLPRFDAQTVWERIERGRDGRSPSVFMAVPTVYSKLIEAYDAQTPARQTQLAAAARKLRLFVSGSAALPVSLLQKWQQITGHTLLERYGMTEIGMALSNPLVGERKPGSVGRPLPGVEVRLVDGEIQVRGPSVFLGYLGREQATREAFTDDGWFKTGDVAEVSVDGYYRILGRSSVDILKTGGYKVSALEIEEELRLHPAVSEVAVVGIADSEWGERVAAAVVLKNPETETPLRQQEQLKELEAWCRERLARYKTPTLWKAVSSLPRNAMGKVTKPEVRSFFDRR
jgi:malonyl-CoA/methylmalonyl-CoA synthetase